MKIILTFPPNKLIQSLVLLFLVSIQAELSFGKCEDEEREMNDAGRAYQDWSAALSEKGFSISKMSHDEKLGRLQVKFDEAKKKQERCMYNIPGDGNDPGVKP